MYISRREILRDTIDSEVSLTSISTNTFLLWAMYKKKCRWKIWIVNFSIINMSQNTTNPILSISLFRLTHAPSFERSCK